MAEVPSRGRRPRPRTRPAASRRTGHDAAAAAAAAGAAPAGWLERFIEARIEDVLNRINVPSRSDIERLNSSVDLLTQKVDALLSRQATTSSRSTRGG